MFLGNAEKSVDKKLISDLWKNVSLGTCLTHKQQKRTAVGFDRATGWGKDW